MTCELPSPTLPSSWAGNMNVVALDLTSAVV